MVLKRGLVAGRDGRGRCSFHSFVRFPGSPAGGLRLTSSYSQIRTHRGGCVDVRLLAATIGLLAALIAVCLLPVSADSTEDRGDGRAEVVIPRPVKTPSYRPRTWVFFAVTAVFGLVFLELRRPSLPG